jgi:hypothetical protein
LEIVEPAPGIDVNTDCVTLQVIGQVVTSEGCVQHRNQFGDVDSVEWIAKLRSATFAWIQAWYNLRRRHSSLGGTSPAKYEKVHQPTATQAA